MAPMPHRRRCSRYWSGVAGASPTASVWWWYAVFQPARMSLSVVCMSSVMVSVATPPT